MVSTGSCALVLISLLSGVWPFARDSFKWLTSTASETAPHESGTSADRQESARGSHGPVASVSAPETARHPVDVRKSTRFRRHPNGGDGGEFWRLHLRVPGNGLSAARLRTRIELNRLRRTWSSPLACRHRCLADGETSEATALVGGGPVVRHVERAAGAGAATQNVPPLSARPRMAVLRRRTTPAAPVAAATETGFRFVRERESVVRRSTLTPLCHLKSLSQDADRRPTNAPISSEGEQLRGPAIWLSGVDPVECSRWPRTRPIRSAAALVSQSPTWA